jgi:hypothetical protein
MLARLLGVTLFMCFRRVPVRFSGFFMVRGCFVMIVFWHYAYS